MLRPQGILDRPSETAGAGLETLFYRSVLALIAYNRLDFQPYYWRTASGVEVDFVLYGRHVLLAFEIKHSKTIHSKMLTGLKHFKQDYPMASCYILYLGDKTLYLPDEIVVLPFVDGLKLLPNLMESLVPHLGSRQS